MMEVTIKAVQIHQYGDADSHIEAGVLPLAGITAWEAMVTVGEVVEGQRVLVHAASGGVGSLAVQIAKARGAYVIGTSSSQNRMLVESLGVDEFIDYQAQPFADVAKDIDVVFDTIGGAAAARSTSDRTSAGTLPIEGDRYPEETERRTGV